MKLSPIAAAVAVLGLSVALATKARADQKQQVADAAKARTDYTAGLIPGFFDLSTHGPEGMVNPDAGGQNSAVPMFSPLP